MSKIHFDVYERPPTQADLDNHFRHVWKQRCRESQQEARRMRLKLVSAFILLAIVVAADVRWMTYNNWFRYAALFSVSVTCVILLTVFLASWFLGDHACALNIAQGIDDPDCVLSPSCRPSLYGPLSPIDNFALGVLQSGDSDIEHYCDQLAKQGRQIVSAEYLALKSWFEHKLALEHRYRYPKISSTHAPVAI
jgi:hypothetical protein